MRNLDDLRQRCVMDADSGCWHFRRGHGRAPDPTKVQTVRVHGVGMVSVTRVAWWAAGLGELRLPAGTWIVRACSSYDCVNPEHLRRMTKRQLVYLTARRGTLRSPAKQAAAREVARRFAVITPELLLWLVESPQSGAAAAHGLGISQGRANVLRQRTRRLVAARSVFDLGASMGAAHDERSQ